jgi:biuret amidohydrolase
MQRAFGLDIPETLEDACHPERMALLVYDMQAGILSQLPGAAEVTARVAEVLGAARESGFRTFFTRHFSLPTEVTGVAGLRTARAWQRVERATDVVPAFPRDSPGFELVPEVAPRPSEALLDKMAMSAFVGSPLELALRDCRITALAVVGVALEVGIEPTVRHAADLGFVPVLVADACGSRDDAARRRALDGLAFAGDAMITETSAICALMRAAPAAA